MERWKGGDTMNVCKRCGRELKSEESKKREYGKRCYELTFGKEEKPIRIGYFYEEMKNKV